MSWSQDVRVSLQHSRNRGVPFEQAWQDATAANPVQVSESGNVMVGDGCSWSTTDWKTFVTFTERHMRAAYYRDGSRLGRCRFTVADWSDVVRDARGREVIA